MTASMRFLEDLNSSQRQVADFDEGPLLVIAGAGSGKTKTLVYRVARLVASGVPPERILLLTFTRKSAQEMLHRAAQVLDARCHQVSGGTFHAFATLILREFYQACGFSSQFSIIDRSDTEDLIQLIRKPYAKASSDKRYPKKNTILDLIGKCINGSKSMIDAIEQHYPQYVDLEDDLKKIAHEFQLKKRKMQVMDYDDLLVFLKNLLEKNTHIRELIQQRYDYVMVDEYQDTNLIQAAILFHLVGKKRNLMVVGDDAQSIYSFRGAHFKNIMSFQDQYPGAVRVTLEQNYRSQQSILDLTNAVIAQAQERFAKNLFTENGKGEKPIYIETKSEHDQSHYVCQKILELREQNIPLNQIAVLVRSGWHSNELEVALQSHQLPFVKFGGFKFIESAHIKDIVAFFRLAFNPSDLVSWHRVLLLLDGIGPKSVQQFLDSLESNQYRLDPCLLDPLKKKASFHDLSALISLFISINTTEKKPVDIFQEISRYYRPIFKDKYDNFHKREADLESFESICKQFKDLESFLTELSLDPPTVSQVDSEFKNDDEALTISTIHSAKGLEWHSVFLISALDGYLPSFQSMGDTQSLEEERRLMYVALTRAKKNLFILKPQASAASFRSSYQGMEFSRLSRFLEENQIISKFAQRAAFKEEKSGFDFKDISQESRASNVLFDSRQDRPSRRPFSL